MSAYDVILLHPPAVYDFRSRPIFPGAMGRSVEVLQFNKVPVGMLSIAEYLDRFGFRTVVDNICDRMLTVPDFDVEKHIRTLDAPVFAVGMNFQQHAQGALEIARLCKEIHPDVLVVMGGLTATYFHEEIIAKYGFVDVVVRAEAEKPLLELVRSYQKTGHVGGTPNLTYRAKISEVNNISTTHEAQVANNGLVVTPLMEASRDLDEFEFTRLDLLQPNTSVYVLGSVPRWSLVVCRGCSFDCTICGGSAYAYKKNFAMDHPAFRSPAKIVEDIEKLVTQGVRHIGLYQDPRAAGENYWPQLRDLLMERKPNFERLSLDLLFPATEDFVRDVANISRNIILHLCPDTGSDEVRHTLGRHYSSADVIETVKLCLKYKVPITNFFSVGLAGESEAEMQKTWELWAELDALHMEAAMQGLFSDIEEDVAIGGEVLGPIVLDPGSRAFDNPEECGYKLLYKNLEDYVEALSQPSWHQWLNYETTLANKASIIDMIQRSTEFVIGQREITGFYSPSEAYYESCRVEADRAVVEAIDEFMKIPDARQRDAHIIAIRQNLDRLEKERMSFLE